MDRDKNKVENTDLHMRMPLSSDYGEDYPDDGRNGCWVCCQLTPKGYYVNITIFLSCASLCPNKKPSAVSLKAFKNFENFADGFDSCAVQENGKETASGSFFPVPLSLIPFLLIT